MTAVRAFALVLWSSLSVLLAACSSTSGRTPSSQIVWDAPPPAGTVTVPRLPPSGLAPAPSGAAARNSAPARPLGRPSPGAVADMRISCLGLAPPGAAPLCDAVAEIVTTGRDPSLALISGDGPRPGDVIIRGPWRDMVAIRIAGSRPRLLAVTGFPSDTIRVGTIPES
ncbi:MAG: hypothetical protein GC191_05510 [Azospirillum sp.]|nr:hypothetical protein [Azospirillum sp.]